MPESQVDLENQQILVTESLHLYRRDPVMVFLLDRLHFTTGKIMVGFTLVALLINIGVAYILPRDPNISTNLEAMALACNTTVQEALQSRTFLSNLGVALLQGGVILPLTVLLYLAMPGLLAELYQSLAKNGIIASKPERDAESKHSYSRFLHRAEKAIDSPLWPIIGLVCIVIYWFFRLSLTCDYSSMLPTYPFWQAFNRILLLLIYSLPLYGAGTTIGRLGAGLVTTGYLFHHFELNINPLHPDQVGGLGVFGRNLVGGILFAVVLGLAAVWLNLNMLMLFPDSAIRPEVGVLGLIYLVLTPLFFYYWLWSPHQALLLARKRALQPLADAFQKAFSTPPALEIASPEEIKARTQQMEEIKQQYDFLLGIFPTWPLPKPSVRNLVATASLPPLSSILTIILPALFPRLPEVFTKLLDLLKK